MHPFTISIRHASLARRSQRGFTLVELITVILILGILAAVALPRYSDLQGKAREAKVRAVGGSMKAASGLVKATALASGISCGTAAVTSSTTPPAPSMEGRSVVLNHCYPQSLTAFDAGILGAANVEASDSWTATIATGPAAGVAGAILEVRLSDAATPADCKVVYTAAASTSAPATVSTVTTGC